MMGRYPFFDIAPGKKDKSIVSAVIESVGLTDKINRSIQSLSGGEKQRVHFARVMAQIYRETKTDLSPKLLLLDEPANNLDPKYQHELLHMAKQKANQEDYAVVTVLHDLNLVSQYADQVLMFKNGKMVRSGSTEEVIQEEYLSLLYDVPTRVIHFDGDTIVQMGVQSKTQINNEIQTLINS
jgi:iron complex transport system ATP-binding protein